MKIAGSTTMTMTTPRMKGVTIAIADPIYPVDAHDVCPSVKDLLKEHGTKIDKIRDALVEDLFYDPAKHNYLWMLRFALSHKKSRNTIAAAKHTQQFRA